jgi:hypothetical protein
MLTLLTSCWLVLDPPNGPHAEGDSPRGPRADYANATAELERTVESVDPLVSPPDRLADAIHALERHGLDLAVDTATREMLTNARLILIWMYLANGEIVMAEATMDDAIRGAGPRPLSVASFGPTVQALYADRLKQLQTAGAGVIDVDCRVPCQVVINEHRSPNPSEPLFLGRHRVWVASRDAPQSAVYDVVLTSPDETHVLIFEPSPPKADMSIFDEETSNGPPPPPELDSASPSPIASPPKTNNHQALRPGQRLLPRWAEGLALGVGLATIAGGVSMFLLDGKCRLGGPANSTCANIYDAEPGKYVVLPLGVAITAISGMFLTFDEVQVGRAKVQQATFQWTVRF